MATNSRIELTVTADQVIALHPCYLTDPPDFAQPGEDGEAVIRRLLAGREAWTALQLCRELPARGVPDRDILWLVLREELIPAPILHELACQFAEAALQREREAEAGRAVSGHPRAGIDADGLQGVWGDHLAFSRLRAGQRG